MQRSNETILELGMKVSVRRSSRNHIGVVTRIEGEYVFVRGTNSDAQSWFLRHLPAA